MTKSDAWSLIAVAYSRAGQGIRTDLTKSGLCNAVNTIATKDIFYFSMMNDLYDAHPDYDGGFWWPIFGDYNHTPNCDHERAMLAQLLSLSLQSR